MKNKDVSKKYAIIAILIALIVVGSALWMVQNNNLKSKQSDASALNARTVICYPNDIVRITSPSSGQSYEVGEKVDITWDQIKVDEPVKVNLISAAAPLDDEYGHCNTAFSRDYFIADKIDSSEGKNTYTWTIPKDYPTELLGDDRVIFLTTDYTIETDRGLLQASRDYSDGFFSITGGRR